MMSSIHGYGSPLWQMLAMPGYVAGKTAYDWWNRPAPAAPAPIPAIGVSDAPETLIAAASGSEPGVFIAPRVETRAPGAPVPPALVPSGATVPMVRMPGWARLILGGGLGVIVLSLLGITLTGKKRRRKRRRRR